MTDKGTTAENAMAAKDKIKMLFLCTSNSCRSQMAESWARHLKSDCIEPFSAGIRPAGVSQRAIEVMAEFRRIRDEMKSFIESLPEALAGAGE
jgi:protein-tyrosine-phosphatase